VKRASIIFADGFEEVEALCVVDLLRRAEVDISMLSLNGDREVTGAHGITLVMDDAFAEASTETMDAIILPGGMPGADHLKESEKLKAFLLQMDKKQKVIAAICAAPTVLNHAGILKGKKVTSYPSLSEEFTESQYMTDSVVEDGNIVTSRGVGTALDFSLVLIKKLVSEEKANSIKSAIIYT
jgi:4-methyl-5(b-hydroxyethyl)-thiazole monophosphate biosynthesis